VGPGRYRLPRDRHHPPEEPGRPDDVTSERITEDEVKTAVKTWLESEGWTVNVAWGRERGIDVDAHRRSQRLIIEAKGEAPPGPQQVNYFLSALGEIAQRMNDPVARYGLALPDHSQYRKLVARLPALARERLKLDVLFVTRDEGQLIVEQS
jgi:hypothetical protein